MTKVEDILNPKYWSKRLKEAENVGEIHQAIFRCPLSRWEEIATVHKEILSTVLPDDATLLDIGCGWGRLMGLLPSTWNSKLLGIDLCPEFVKCARENYPWQRFAVADLTNVTADYLQSLIYNALRKERVDFAILISFKPMIVRNLGGEAWDNIHRKLHAVANNLLYLEYDPEDNGILEAVVR